MLCFSVAKELGMTVAQLKEAMSRAEILGWSAYFQIVNEEQERSMKAAKRKKR